MSNSESVIVLMPAISDHERFMIRYTGLEKALGKLGVSSAFAESHSSYNQETHSFDRLFKADLDKVEPLPEIGVVRDLTMPHDHKPLYEDPESPLVVHDPAFNDFLRRKDEVYATLPEVHPVTIMTNGDDLEEAAAAVPGYRVILKPVSGAGAKDVRVVRKKDISKTKVNSSYLVQEFIDTSAGDPNLGIESTHNIRVISIGSNAVGAVARVGGKRKSILRADGYGEVFEPERLPEDIHAITGKVHEKFKGLPGQGNNVIAIDLMYGRSKGSESRYVVCEINRRPVRISPWDLRRDDIQDPKGILWLGNEWDREEAKMLGSLARRG